MPMTLLVAGLFPLGCLGLLLWLGRLEDTLADDVKRTGRGATPPPVVAVPLRDDAAKPAADARPASAASRAPAARPASARRRREPTADLVVEGPEAVA